MQNIKCRLCKSGNLKMFLDLGFTPPSDSFLTKEELNQPETYYPLQVCLCMNCGHMQIGYTVSGEVLYCRNYPYDNSTSLTFRNHFISMSQHICKKFNLAKNSFVIDIGSNVGILLSGFKEQGMKVLGVEPAENIAKKAIERRIETIQGFFSSQMAKSIAEERGKVSIITATNVFAHIPDVDDFMKGICSLLDEKGIFIFEVPYALVMVEKLLYDMIYHEHLGYISIKPIIPFFKKFHMEIFDIEMIPTHGGSLRVFVGREGVWQISDAIEEFVKKEEMAKLHSLETLNQFAEKVKKHRDELLYMLLDLKRQGKKIVGIGAPAKGNTLINYCKIGTEILDCITEKADTKIGLYTPGMHIPIYPDDKLKSDKSDYALLLSWNLSEEIMKNLQFYKNNGGKFIIPFSQPRIVD